MARRLDGKVAFITGGARGQGAAEAALFSDEGAVVIVTDLNDADGEKVVASLPGEALYLHLDVTDWEAWQVVAEQVRDRYGRLDVLINNAGIAQADGLKRFDQLKIETHHKMFDVHVHGTFYGMRAMLPLLEASGNASIVNISSIDGLAGVLGMTSYTGTKFAVTGLTKSAAIELGPLGIRVNSIHPGIINSPMVLGAPDHIRARLDGIIARQPIARAGTPEDIANMALFLASDESSYCTGAQFTVDGGHLAGPYRDPLPE
jgi:3alpha(or 20beta)-hydroxysteroid dehydrogenase